MKWKRYNDYESYSDDSDYSENAEDSPEKQVRSELDEIYYRLRADYLEYCSSIIDVPVNQYEFTEELEQYLSPNKISFDFALENAV